MRTVNTTAIADAIEQTIAEISVNVSPDTVAALRAAESCETRTLSRFALNAINRNIEIARKTATPVCQDTGMCIIFINIGSEITLEGEFVSDAVNNAVCRAYKPLRKSVTSPLERVNTQTNTPAVIHYDYIKGDKIEISVLLKGFGSENMSKLYMLSPSKGIDGVKNCIIETARSAGGNPCPPIILGVGIGGTMEKACLLSKQALLRELGTDNPVKLLDDIEKDCLNRINALGIGAEGFGGDTTCLGVNIIEFPTHIASIPVAITVQCHCSRHKTIII